MDIHSRKLHYLIFFSVTALFLTFIFIVFHRIYSTPSEGISFSVGSPVSCPDGTVRDVEKTWFIDDFPDHSFKTGSYSITYSVDLDDKQRAGTSQYVLCFPYTAGTGISVSINGHVAGSMGDMYRGRANIWNSAFILPIQKGILEKNNRIDVRIFGLYEAGILVEPYLVPRYEHEFQLAALEFVSNTGIWMLCGAIFILSLTLVLIGLQALPEIDARLLLGGAGILSFLFMLDFVSLEYVMIPVVQLKRLLVITRHLGALLFVWGYIRLLHRGRDLFAVLFTIVQIVCVVLLLFPDSMVQLKNVYIYTYLSVAPLMVYILFLLLSAGKGETKNLFLISGVSIALICVMRDIAAPFLSRDVVYISHYGFMIMVFMTSIFIVMDFMKNYRQLLVERKRAELYREASFHDPLTQLFNRSIIPYVRESLYGVFSVIAIDLNDFKVINDTYGHVTGDRVLKDLAVRLNRVFRRDDYLIRTGGDEFLVVLSNCPGEKLDSIMSKLLADIKEAVIIISPQTHPGIKESLYGTLTYSISAGFSSYEGEERIQAHQFEQIICEADTSMYACKRQLKKGRTKHEA